MIVNNFVFDPDSLIQTIKISVRTVETDQSIINNAISQDKIIYNASQGNQFSAIENQKADILISIPNEIISSQTLSQNKVQVLQTLRDLSYNNPESLENLVSGFRDVKIEFINQNGLETKVFDSSINSSLPKLLVGKAFQPGDTHVGLNIAINESQITSGEDIVKVLFTIETDNGTSDKNDQLFLLNQNGNIIESLNYSSEVSNFLKFEWFPSAETTLSETISQLKDKIGFGGEHIELSGLRSVKVEIFNLNNELIGPSDLKTTVFVQENVNQTTLGTSDGKLINVSDADGVGTEDVISYAGYNGQERLTIDIGFETVKTTSSNDVTNLTQASGFEGVLGSSKDDTIISSGAINKIAGGSGDDALIGDEQDFVDYSLEQSFSHQSQAFHLNEGIVANLQTGQVIDTYGYKDTSKK